MAVYLWWTIIFTPGDYMRTCTLVRIVFHWCALVTTQADASWSAGELFIHCIVAFAQFHSNAWIEAVARLSLSHVPRSVLYKFSRPPEPNKLSQTAKEKTEHVELTIFSGRRWCAAKISNETAFYHSRLVVKQFQCMSPVDTFLVGVRALFRHVCKAFWNWMAFWCLCIHFKQSHHDCYIDLANIRRKWSILHGKYWM